MESHLRYGNMVWGHLPETKLHTLQKIQNMAFYLIESAPIKDQIPSTWLNVEKLITYDWAIMVHKILAGICPENLKGKFTRRSQITKYETRKINDLQIPKTRLEVSKKRLSYVGAKVWHDIPNDIRNVKSTYLFKKQMKSYLLGQ